MERALDDSDLKRVMTDAKHTLADASCSRCLVLDAATALVELLLGDWWQQGLLLCNEVAADNKRTSADMQGLAVALVAAASEA